MAPRGQDRRAEANQSWWNDCPIVDRCGYRPGPKVQTTNEVKEEMSTLTSGDWWAILHATAEDVNARLADGTLKPPLRILITGGDDGKALEGTRFPVKRNASGQRGGRPLAHESAYLDHQI